MQTISQLSIATVFAVLLCACTPSEKHSADAHRTQSKNSETSQPIAAQFESISRSAVASGTIEGIQFALVEGGQTLSAQAFGLADRERQVAMTVDTPINVASISKSLTAWGVLAFLDNQNRGLDASVRQLLLDHELYDEIFPGVDVTIRMLLSHTSGLSGSSVPVTPATEPVPGIDDVLVGRSSVRRPRLRHAPSSTFLYSGAGYLVLQKMIEDQTRLPFANYMAQTVLGPAQMLNSAFALTPQMMSRVAVYYRADGRRREPYHLPGAAGGLYSTASDMALYLNLYLGNGRETRGRIIEEDKFAALLDPVIRAIDADGPVQNIQYALGHYTYSTPEGTRVVFHAGGNPGLRAIYIIAPDRDAGFFAVTNNDNGSEILAKLMRVWGDYYGLTLHEYF